MENQAEIEQNNSQPQRKKKNYEVPQVRNHEAALDIIDGKPTTPTEAFFIKPEQSDHRNELGDGMGDIWVDPPVRGGAMSLDLGYQKQCQAFATGSLTIMMV